jgi:hypothetical protein
MPTAATPAHDFFALGVTQVGYKAELTRVTQLVQQSPAMPSNSLSGDLAAPALDWAVDGSQDGGTASHQGSGGSQHGHGVICEGSGGLVRASMVLATNVSAHGKRLWTETPFF